MFSLKLSFCILHTIACNYVIFWTYPNLYDSLWLLKRRETEFLEKYWGGRRQLWWQTFSPGFEWWQLYTEPLIKQKIYNFLNIQKRLISSISNRRRLMDVCVCLFSKANIITTVWNRKNQMADLPANVIPQPHPCNKNFQTLSEMNNLWLW